MSKSDERRNRQLAREQRERARAHRMLAIPSGEKPAADDANKKPQTKKQKDNKKKVSRSDDSKDWETVLYVIIGVLITIVLGAVALPFSSHPSLSLWASVAALSLLNLLITFALRQRICRGSHSRRVVVRVSLVAEVCFICMGVGVQYWMQTHLGSHARGYGKLSGEERTKFVEALKGQSTSREKIRLGCAVESERACVFAGQLYELFDEAEWEIVGNQVERGEEGKPMAGVALHKRGTWATPQARHSGIWVLQTESLQTLEKAFNSIGIETTQVADWGMDEGTIGVFVGAEP